MPDVVLKDIAGSEWTYSDINTVSLKTTDGGVASYVSQHLIQNQVQADWNQTDETAVDFIKNKPTIFETEAELPEVTIEDNGKVLGVVGGEWKTMNVSCGESGGLSGIIEKTEIISLNTDKSATAARIDVLFNDIHLVLYKLDEHMPTKSELLAAQWQISDIGGAPLCKKQLTKNEIVIETPDILAFQFAIAPEYGYAICYTTGTIIIEYLGSTITIEIPETGVYQLWVSELGDLPTTIIGECVYQHTETVNFVQSNWNQNDYTQADYIKNRICSSRNNDIIFYQNSQAAFKAVADDYGLKHHLAHNQIDKDLVSQWQSDWTTAIVKWDGIEFICHPHNVFGIKCIGNIEATSNGEPFMLGYGASPYEANSQSRFEFYDLTEQANYILNTSISESEFTTSIDETYQTAVLANTSLNQDMNYYIQLNEAIYEVYAHTYVYNNEEIIGMGNPNIIGLSTEEATANLPFFIYYNSIGEVIIATPVTYTDIVCYIRTNPIIYHNVSITLKNEEVTPINPKFIQNVNYETQVINKPFGIQTKELIPISEISVLEYDGEGAYSAAIKNIDYTSFKNNTVYTIQIGNAAVKGKCKKIISEDTTVITIQADGIWLLASETIDNGVLFISSSIFTDDTVTVGQNVYVKVSAQANTIQKINPIFLPSGNGYDEGVKSATLDINNLPQDHVLNLVYKISDDALTLEQLSNATFTGTYIARDGENTVTNFTGNILSMILIYEVTNIKLYQIALIDTTTSFTCIALVLVANNTGIYNFNDVSVEVPSAGTYAFFEGDNGEDFNTITIAYNYKQQLSNTLLQCLEAQSNETIIETTEFTCATPNDNGRYMTTLDNLPPLLVNEQYMITLDECQEIYTAVDFDGSIMLGAYLGSGICIINNHNMYSIMMSDDAQHILKVEKLGNYTLKETYLPSTLYAKIDQRIEDYINEALGGEY